MEVFRKFLECANISWMKKDREYAIEYLKEQHPEINIENIKIQFQPNGFLFVQEYFVRWDTLDKYKAKKQGKPYKKKKYKWWYGSRME